MSLSQFSLALGLALYQWLRRLVQLPHEITDSPTSPHGGLKTQYVVYYTVLNEKSVMCFIL